MKEPNNIDNRTTADSGIRFLLVAADILKVKEKFILTPIYAKISRSVAIFFIAPAENCYNN